MRTVAVVGCGLSGALTALKLRRADPAGIRVLAIEAGRRFGRGVAYGACAPQHLLNVPVSRMEVGLTPSFGAWLQSAPHAAAALQDALSESGGDLQAAFAPRALFGDYLEARLVQGLTTGAGPGIVAVRGEAVGVLDPPRRGLRLADGREIEADIVVLATGNLAPGRPGGPDAWLYDSPRFIPDPWAPDAFAEVGRHEPLLLMGAGLTMVDVALKLAALGCEGPMLAISRRGLLPQTHLAGGAWPAFLERALPASPRTLMRLIRAQVAAAAAQGVPWQRVFDAARPAVPAVWQSWSLPQKRQFLRHLRPRWDVHRHRMAPRIAAALHALIETGRLEVMAARVRAWRPDADGQPRIEATLAPRAGGARRVSAAWVINCTGPRRDLARLATPLIADLRARGLLQPDSLGLGLETQDGALLTRTGQPSDWLFAVGPLTCPSWWEIVAVPEINLQVDALVASLTAPGPSPRTRLMSEEFLDLGAGI
jgi:uncharacterized NAD(P)/FAD-binding protein YdhS